jgi:hypothetical protein
MTARLTPKTLTEADVLESLEQWAARLSEAQRGCNMPTETECRKQLDHWLEEYALLLRVAGLADELERRCPTSA